MTMKKGTEIPTIDVVLVTIVAGASEYAIKTANKIVVEPQIEKTDAVKLLVKGVLLAQKNEESTITGNKITLTDNVLIPEVVKILQGGTITYDTTDVTKVIGYKPPVAGSTDKGEDFVLCAYSAIYDTAGSITGYEKISYPNCKGAPVAFSSEDGKFRTPEYTITTAPKTGEAPYEISIIDSTALPTVV